MHSWASYVLIGAYAWSALAGTYQASKKSPGYAAVYLATAGASIAFFAGWVLPAGGFVW